MGRKASTTAAGYMRSPFTHVQLPHQRRTSLLDGELSAPSATLVRSSMTTRSSSEDGCLPGLSPLSLGPKAAGTMDSLKSLRRHPSANPFLDVQLSAPAPASTNLRRHASATPALDTQLSPLAPTPSTLRRHPSANPFLDVQLSPLSPLPPSAAAPAGHKRRPSLLVPDRESASVVDSRAAAPALGQGRFAGLNLRSISSKT